MQQQQIVLLVDDEPDALAAVARSIRLTPYRVLTAQSGAEALRVLADSPVAAVVTDESMPNMTGTELLQIVRRDYPSTVRMILTGNSDYTVAVQALNAGTVQQFMAKPVDAILLRRLLEQALTPKATGDWGDSGSVDTRTHSQRLPGSAGNVGSLGNVGNVGNDSGLVGSAPEDVRDAGVAHPYLLMCDQREDEDDAYQTVVVRAGQVPDAPAGQEQLVSLRKRAGANTFSFITIGRAQNNDIVLRSREVSKNHAYISVRGDTYFIADAGSKNGTFLNGEQLTRSGLMPMSDGDQIRVAPSIVGTFMSPESAEDWRRGR